MMKTPDLRDLRLPLLAWGVVALVSIFLHGPVPLYSTRSLAVAWEMWDRGSWLVPLFNGAPYSHKTPLLPWLIHAGWLVTGVSDVWPRVLMVLLGGLGTVFGPVVGAAVIVTLQNYLAQLGAWVTVVQGVIFVVCVLAFRRGIVGELGHWLKKPL